MKKSNFLKLAFIVVAMFAFASSFAQGVSTNYVNIAPGTAATGLNLSFVTEGKAIPLYVTPDVNYHPSWVFPSTGLTPNFTWSVTGAAITGGSLTLNQPSTLNYFELTGVTIGGPYLINAKEVAGAAFGGCSDAGLNFNIQVLPKPTAGIIGAALDASWQTTTAGYSYYRCGNLAGGENLTVTISELGVLTANASYAFSIEKRSVNIDVANAEIVASIVASNLVDHPTTAKYAGVNDGATQIITTGALNVLNSLRTKYTFTLKRGSNLPGLPAAQGVVSAVSQKSDYVTAMNLPLAGNNVMGLDEITMYPFTNPVIVQYIVNPNPTTGPIFHIPNNYAF